MPQPFALLHSPHPPHSRTSLRPPAPRPACRSSSVPRPASERHRWPPRAHTHRMAR
jgi:hypothetical protein